MTDSQRLSFSGNWIVGCCFGSRDLFHWIRVAISCNWPAWMLKTIAYKSHFPFFVLYIAVLRAFLCCEGVMGHLSTSTSTVEIPREFSRYRSICQKSSIVFSNVSGFRIILQRGGWEYLQNDVAGCGTISNISKLILAA